MMDIELLARRPVSRMTEAILLGSRREVARPCVCGGVVVADPQDPGEGVRCHQAEPRHVAWRAWVES